MRDFKTTLAGFLTLGLTVASFLVKNQDTKGILIALATAMGSGGLMVAKDATPAPPVAPPAAAPVIVIPPSPAPPEAPKPS